MPNRDIVAERGEFQLLDLTYNRPNIRGKNRIFCITCRGDEIELYWRKGKTVYSRSLMHEANIPHNVEAICAWTDMRCRAIDILNEKEPE